MAIQVNLQNIMLSGKSSCKMIFCETLFVTIEMIKLQKWGEYYWLLEVRVGEV